MDLTTKASGRADAGFSLIEMLFALVLISILTSMAVPSMTGYVDRANTRKALDRLVADANLARIMAIQQARPVAIVVTAGSTYRIDTLSTAGTWAAAKTVDLALEYPEVGFVAALDLQFNSRGLLSNLGSDGFVKITRNGVRDSVFISPAGRMYRDY